MIRTQRHSRFVLMSLDEIRATRDIVLQTEETKSNFSGSGKTVYICEVVRPCDYQKETDTAADKLAAEIERVNADNRALRRKVERLERELHAHAWRRKHDECYGARLHRPFQRRAHNHHYRNGHRGK